MKTYVLDILNRIRRKSEELDAKTILTNKAWKIFNDDDVEETIYFREDGTLLVVVNGRTTGGTWEVFVEDKSVHIIYDGQKNGIMFKPTFKADGILALQLYGTEQYAFLADKKNESFNNIKSLNDLINFYKRIEKEKELRLIEEVEEQKRKEEAERIKRESEIIEKERLIKLEEERVKKSEYLDNCLKKRNEISRKFSKFNRIFDVRNYSVDEIMYEINFLYKKNKNFLKFIKLRKKVPKYKSIYVSSLSSTWFSLSVKIVFAWFIPCGVFWGILKGNYDNYDCEEKLLFVLVALLVGIVLTLCLGYENISDIRKKKRVLFLKEEEEFYEWYDNIVFQKIFIKNEISEEEKNKHIVETYKEKVSKRMFLVNDKRLNRFSCFINRDGKYEIY